MISTATFFRESALSETAQPSTLTTCPYCGVGCGVEVTKNTQQAITVQGDAHHPANFGQLCSKGRQLHETIGLEHRFLYPEVDDVRVSWNEAIAACATRLKDILEKHGPSAIAFYVSGQLLTEDYYVANKFIKGFIGSPHIDTNSRLCMSSSVVGYKRAFGADSVPLCYEDFEHAQMIVMIGSNLAWCHPVLFQRIRRIREESPNLKIVVIDPRQTSTSDIADLYLPITPGTDTFLFLGLFRYLLEQGAENKTFVEQYTENSEAIKNTALTGSYTIPEIANITGLTVESITSFFELFLRYEKTISLYSQGVNQSSNGSDKVNAIINCHLLTGRVGEKGAGPFSITGQPNAMGGREVGGLANQLAAHMDYQPEAIRLVSDFWQTSKVPTTEGKKAVDLFRAIGEGEIKAVWIISTNPLVSLPNVSEVEKALQKAECVIVSDISHQAEILKLAHIRLPAAAWGEKDGMVTNSERRLSRQRAFLPLPGEARPDWWILSEVAKKMGFSEHFSYESAFDIFKEHVALSAFKNQPDEIHRDFNLSGLMSLTSSEYERFSPIQWPVLAPGEGTARLFLDKKFYTPSQKARFVSVSANPAKGTLSEQYPLILNTGRVRDHWHTLTRSGLSPALSRHISEPFCMINTKTAKEYDIEEQDFLEVSSAQGCILLKAKIDDSVQEGQLFAPIHWHDTLSKNAQVGRLIAPWVDPYSGQPEFKYTPVSIKKRTFDWVGFVMCTDKIDTTIFDDWVAVTESHAVRYEVAMQGDFDLIKQITQNLLKTDDNNEWLEYQDKTSGVFRGAWLHQGQLKYVVMLAKTRALLPSPEYVASLFTSALQEPSQWQEPSKRIAILAGQSAGPTIDKGKIICTCMNVGLNQILEAISVGGVRQVEELGVCLKAGTQCGSCVPELKSILKNLLY